MADETKVGEARAGFEKGEPPQRRRFDFPLSTVLAFEAGQLDAGTCSVCGGQPLASGRKCVCGGKGTYDAEVVGLRLYIFELEGELEQSRAVLSAAEEWRVYEKKGTRWHTVRLQKLAALRKAVDELRRARGEKEGEAS